MSNAICSCFLSITVATLTAPVPCSIISLLLPARRWKYREIRASWPARLRRDFAGFAQIFDLIPNLVGPAVDENSLMLPFS
jgi:hypothetical protein